MHMCVRVCMDTSVYIYAQVSKSMSRNGKLNKHSSLVIFDKNLVRQTNQGLPMILPQYPLETALTVT